MKIIKTSELVNTRRQVRCPKGGFISHRILLESDDMGYTLTETHVPKGTPQFWHYKNHLESCYCSSGRGILIDATSEEEFLIEPGTTYVLDKNDPHYFMAIEDTVLICVFNPPLKGDEVHRPDGSYEGGSYE